ncbi:MAG: HEAT repeat domain-containing protein, partial [Candidatus Hodarchaeota archaeon]
MIEEEVLSDFQSNIDERLYKALKLCIVDDSLFLNKEILTQVFYLLNHENYHLRDETEGILNFVVKYIPESHNLLSNLLAETLIDKENSNELMFRCLKLFVLLNKESLSTQLVMNLLNSETNYAQGFMTFILRDFFKEDPEFLSSVLDIVVKEKENIPTDTKKVICWLFWKNPTIFNSSALNTLSILVNDEDREVRRLICEILVQMIDDLRYRDKIIHILEQRVIDESWRVQKIAIKGLILSTLCHHPLNPKFWDKIIGLFWDTAWQVRRNICQILPNLLPLQDENNSIFLEVLITALDDENWEVREGSAISLNQHLDLGKNKYGYILNKILDLTD